MFILCCPLLHEYLPVDRNLDDASSWTLSQDVDDVDREIQKVEEGKLILQQDVESENWVKKRYQEQIEITTNQLKQIPPVDNARNTLTSSHATGESSIRSSPQILRFGKSKFAFVKF